MMTVMTGRDADEWPLGDLLREAREKAGFSIREAAKAAGFSPTTWTSLETGTRLIDGERQSAKPRAENVIAAAEVVGVDPNNALRLAGYNARVHGMAPRSRPTVSQHALLERIGLLTEKQRQAVNEVVDAMLLPVDDDGDNQPPSYIEKSGQLEAYEEVVSDDRSGGV